MSKRHRISFGECELIPMDPELVSQACKNMNKVMKPIVREYKRKQFLSALEASQSYLNT